MDEILKVAIQMKAIEGYFPISSSIFFEMTLALGFSFLFKDRSLWIVNQDLIYNPFISTKLCWSYWSSVCASGPVHIRAQ